MLEYDVEVAQGGIGALCGCRDMQKRKLPDHTVNTVLPNTKNGYGNST